MSTPVALITGGTRGLGFGAASSLAGEGYNLALNGVRGDDLVADALASIESLGVEAIYCPGDISKTDDRAQIVDLTLSRFGRIDLLLNNAGITSPGRRDILEATEDAFDLVLGTNLKGPYFLTQSVARQMIAQRKAEPAFVGRIVTITSINATVASTSRGDYCVSKAGLSMASTLWAARLAEYGIECFEIRPGIMKTDMTVPVRAKYDRLIAEGLTLEPRWGLPDDIGNVVASIARGDLSYATGLVLTIDGGLTVQTL